MVFRVRNRLKATECGPFQKEILLIELRSGQTELVNGLRIQDPSRGTFLDRKKNSRLVVSRKKRSKFCGFCVVVGRQENATLFVSVFLKQE